MRFAILFFSAQNGPKLGQSSAGAGRLGLVPALGADWNILEETHLYLPASLHSFFVQALNASSSSSTNHYKELLPQYQQLTAYSSTKYITPHKEFNTQFSIRGIHKSAMLDEIIPPINVLREINPYINPTSQNSGNGLNISEMIGGGPGHGKQIYTMPLRTHNGIRYFPWYKRRSLM